MANIQELNNNYTRPVPLTKKEQRLLKKKMLGYGNVQMIVEKSEVPRTCVYDAASGKNLSAENLKKIRAFLNE
jgi:hypothetical protein